MLIRTVSAVLPRCIVILERPMSELLREESMYYNQALELCDRLQPARCRLGFQASTRSSGAVLARWIVTFKDIMPELLQENGIPPAPSKTGGDVVSTAAAGVPCLASGP